MTEPLSGPLSNPETEPTGRSSDPPPPNTTRYAPPSTATMRRTQDTKAALRLLLAQRRRYSAAKRWLNLKWTGMVLIALGAPVVSLIWPDLAVVAGATAGIWIFAGRTIFDHVHQIGTSAAASIQERFDQLVFGMPVSVSRSTLPLEEQIADLVGAPAEFEAAIMKQKLRAWYRLEDPDSARAVAIAQRSNLAYSKSLLDATAKVWVGLTLGWVALLIVISRTQSLSTDEILVGVLFPVLPAGLDVFEYIVGMRKESREREDLARTIEDRLRSNGRPLTPDQLLVWQDSLFRLRSAPAHVPDRIYSWTRNKREQEMHDAARQLSNPRRG